MTSEMATTGARELTHGALEFSEEQRQMIRDSFANGASDAEFAVLLEIAKARRLNPLLRQIHFVSRWDGEKRRSVWAAQVSIDGLRAIAERTGLYAGQDEPEFGENPDGTLKLCKVRVYRKDWPRPAVGVAYWSEYVQTFRDKQGGGERVAPMWRKMPHVMLAKVSEALALRKAFPEDMSGLYAPEEMAQASNGTLVEVESAPTTETKAKGTLAEVVHARTTWERDEDSESAAAEEPQVLRDFYGRVEGIELPGEAVALWMKHRADLAALPGGHRESAWKALCKKTEQVGRMKNAKVWLKKAIAIEDARGPGLTVARPEDDEPPPTGTGPGKSTPKNTAANGTGSSAVGSTGSSPRARAWTEEEVCSLPQAWEAHLRRKPHVLDPANARGRTSEYAELASGYLKRREAFQAAGISDEALDILRAELRVRGCMEPDALLAGVIGRRQKAA